MFPAWVKSLACLRQGQKGEEKSRDDKALINPLSYFEKYLIYLQFLFGIHPKDLVSLQVALGNWEKEILLGIGSALGCQEKGSRSEVGGRGMRDPGGVYWESRKHRGLCQG